MKNQSKYIRCPICSSRLNARNLSKHNRKMHSGISVQEIVVQPTPKKTSISTKQSKPKTSGKLDYYEYIASPGWKEKSRLAKERAGNRCQICYRSSAQSVLHTHHRTYKRLGNELDSDLTVLCSGCHKLYEDNKKSPKYY